MLQPLRGKLIVEVLDDAKRTNSGLWLAGVKQEIPHRGRIVTLGLPYRDKKGKEYPWGIQPSHIVHFKRVWDQEKIKHYILRREQIYAIEHEDKAYAFAEYIIIKKENIETGRIYVPDHFDVKVEKQEAYGIVTSIGRDSKLGLNVDDKIMYFKGEGLSVRIPLQEELWSLKPRAVFAKI